MYNAILSQIGHPPGFTAEMLQKMVGLYMIKHPELFFDLLSDVLDKGKESYESYCVNVFKGKYWGDNIVISVIVKMWLISISLVLPGFRMPLEFQHNDPEPDVVIVGNGGDQDLFHPCDHFSQTRYLNQEKRIVGIEMVEAKVEKYDDAKQAARDAQVWAAEREKKIVLDRWVSIQTKIDRLADNIEDLTFRKNRAQEDASSLELDILDMGIDIQHYKKAQRAVPSMELKEGVRTADSVVLKEEESEDIIEEQLVSNEEVVDLELESEKPGEDVEEVVEISDENDEKKRKHQAGLLALKKMKIGNTILSYLGKRTTEEESASTSPSGKSKVIIIIYVNTYKKLLQINCKILGNHINKLQITK